MYEVMQQYITLCAVCVTGTREELEAYAERVSHTKLPLPRLLLPCFAMIIQFCVICNSSLAVSSKQPYCLNGPWLTPGANHVPLCHALVYAKSFTVQRVRAIVQRFDINQGSTSCFQEMECTLLYATTH